MSITTAEELAGMQAAGAVARQVVETMKLKVQPGVTTAELDAIGNRVMLENGARSAPAMVYDFPGGSCISVNDEVVHGIPGDRVLEEGNLVKLDVTIEKNGFMADTAATVAVGIRCVPDARETDPAVARPRPLAGADEPAHAMASRGLRRYAGQTPRSCCTPRGMRGSGQW